MSNRNTKAALLASSVIFGSLLAAPALAQETDPGATEGERIVVTGSRIATQNVDTAAPIAVVDSEEFSLSGTVNVENVINTLPQVVPGFTSNSNNPGTGTATLNLRGLGSSRTMVLVNGRRWMFYDTGQIVDLNTIPQFLLQNVDVVTGGASAVYGSDALAGVVNFNLRHVDGVEVGGQYSITDRGDGERYQLHGAIGTEFGDGRGRATVFGEYYNRSSIFQGGRGFSEFAIGGETPGNGSSPQIQFGSSTLPSGVIRYLAPNNGNLAGTDFAANRAVVFDTAGEFRTRTGDTYNYAPVNYLQIPQERYLLGGYAEYEISEGIEAYTEVAFVNNRVATELAATPVTGTFNVDLSTIQPFLSAGDFAQLQQLDATETGTGAAAGGNGQLSLFLQRRITETGARNSLDERNAFRVLAGLRGDLTDFLSYDAYYMYARTRNANVQAGNISRSAFQAGLDGTGTAINIFGPDTLTPEMVDAISIQAQNGDISTLEVATAYLSGTFGDFAIGNAAPIGFALGGEYRSVASRFIPDTALSSGDVIGFNAGEATEGSYDVKEVFAELNIPVLDTDSGLRLELNGAARYSDYSVETVGGVWAYAGGIQFAPVEGITLRGQYQRAVRAPNVSELFGGTAIGFPGATDPCSTAAAATPGTLRDLCIQSGVPAGIVGTGAVQINAQIPALFGGNPNLQEETSDSWTYGIVLQPSFIPGLTITADYFDIVIEDAISTISLATSFDLCFNQVQDASSGICAPFFANPNGSIRTGGIIDVGNPPILGGQNVATLAVSGIDFQLNYGLELPFSVFSSGGSSDFDIGLLATWTERNDFEAFPGADVVSCAGEFGAECGDPTASFKWTARFSWVDGPFTLSSRWRHLSAVEDDDDGVNYTQFNGVERIPAYDLIDLTMSYDFNDTMTFSVGVNNLFDTLPQTPTFDGILVSSTNNGTLLGDNQEQGNTYPSTYDVLGRDFFASVLVRF